MPISCELRLGAFSARGAAPGVASVVEVTESRGDQCKVEVLTVSRAEHGRVGHFRVKGEVIDIFPADSDERAVRIEMFDDEVESLSWFDPLTGEKLQSLQRITIYPKTHYVTPESTIQNMLDEA